MNNEKDTEKIISDKLNSRGFAFDEKAWEGMETLLDEQEKKRRRGAFWRVAIFTLAILVLGGVYFFSEKPEPVYEKPEFVFGKSNQDFEKPEIDFEKQEIDFEKPEIDFEKPEIDFEKPEIDFEKPEIDFEKPEIDFEKPEIDFEKPEIDFEKPEIDFEKPEGNSEKQQALSTGETGLEAGADTINDAVTLSPETEAIIPVAPGKETQNAWGILAGTGYWFPYQQTLGASSLKGGFPFTGGIYYQRALSKRFELGLSALYSARGALNLNHTFYSTDFGFGLLSEKFIVSPQTLHYFTVPLCIRFNATPRSHFSIGAAYYHLLATTSKVTRIVEDSFGVVESSSEKQTGNHPGFRKNDVAAFLGYEFTLFERMNMGLQFSYGFYDITNNGYNNITQTDRNLSLQLQLKYDLIRH